MMATAELFKEETPGFPKSKGVNRYCAFTLKEIAEALACDEECYGDMNWDYAEVSREDEADWYLVRTRTGKDTRIECYIDGNLTDTVIVKR